MPIASEDSVLLAPRPAYRRLQTMESKLRWKNTLVLLDTGSNNVAIELRYRTPVASVLELCFAGNVG